MIAALQMYDWPEVQSDYDAFWALIRDALTTEGVTVPGTLSRPADIAVPWIDGGLILGQTCGLPYTMLRCADAVPIARAGYPADMAGRGMYASALVIRADGPDRLEDLHGSRLALNGWDSQSGCNAMADHLIAHGLAKPITDAVPFFSGVRITGAHRASAQEVAEGRADLAAIDAVAWALFQALNPAQSAKLKVLAWTRPMPGLPFITARSHVHRKGALLAALTRAAAVVASKPWLPNAIYPATPQDYEPIAQMARRVRGLVLAPDAPPLGGNDL